MVGTRVGRWFLPSFSGVAFSRNGSAGRRIRARTASCGSCPASARARWTRDQDDYPVLLAPGQPGLRVNVTPDEVVRYAPKMADVINLETGEFETVAVADLLRSTGHDLPRAAQMVSILGEDHLRRPAGTHVDFEDQQLVVTFEGLTKRRRVHAPDEGGPRGARARMGVPVDIEFASDGRHLYLLQCRPQSSFGDSQPSPIPRNLPREQCCSPPTVSYRTAASRTSRTSCTWTRRVTATSATSRRCAGSAASSGGSTGCCQAPVALLGPGRWGSRG